MSAPKELRDPQIHTRSRSTPLLTIISPLFDESATFHGGVCIDKVTDERSLLGEWEMEMVRERSG